MLRLVVIRTIWRGKTLLSDGGRRRASRIQVDDMLLRWQIPVAVRNVGQTEITEIRFQFVPQMIGKFNCLQSDKRVVS